MRPAKRARKQLKSNWNGAITVQCVLLAAGILLAVLEFGALYLMGLGISQGVSIEGLLQGRDNGWRLGILLIAVLLDLLLTSPLRAGQAAYYRLVSEPGPPPLRPVSEITDEAGTRLVIDEDPSPVPSSVPTRVIWRFYGSKLYGKSVRWRLSIWMLRLFWSLIWFAPAALAFGYGEWLRRGSVSTSFMEITLIFTVIFGLFALIAGFVAVQLTMLRYMPAQYLLAEQPTVRAALRESRRLMKGQVGQIAWLYLGFSGWLFACLALLPYFYASPLFLTTRAGAVHRLERQSPASEPEAPPSPAPSKHRTPRRRHA